MALRYIKSMIIIGLAVTLIYTKAVCASLRY